MYGKPIYFKSFRVESLSDGVFSIAMTLLILEIKIPNAIEIHSERDFINYLIGLNHKIYSYCLSFIILGIYWIGHHRQFLFIRHSDRVSLWFNVFFLLAVSLVPFSTELLGEFNQFKSVIFLYGSNICLIGFLLWLNWEYSYRNNLMMIENTNIDYKIFKLIRIRTLIAPVLYLVGIGLAYYSTRYSLILFGIVQLIYIVPFKFIKNL